VGIKQFFTTKSPTHHLLNEESVVEFLVYNNNLITHLSWTSPASSHVVKSRKLLCGSGNNDTATKWANTNAETL